MHSYSYVCSYVNFSGDTNYTDVNFPDAGQMMMRMKHLQGVQRLAVSLLSSTKNTIGTDSFKREHYKMSRSCDLIFRDCSIQSS